MKKTAIIGVAVLLALSLVLVGCDNPIEGEASARRNNPDDVTLKDVGFHCNTFGGNGRVWISNYDAKDEIKLVRVDETTWKLTNRNDYYCPNVGCGKNVWVSYSNKNGVPSGKNVQLTHPVEIKPPEPKDQFGYISAEVNLLETWFKDYHKPVYREASNNTNTLVTRSGNAFNNGQTWVAINVAAARAGSLQFEIADSSPQNRPIGYFYNVKIVDDNITVYLDDNIIRADFGFEVQNTSGALAGGPKNTKHGNLRTNTQSLPAGYGDTVYLFFHNQGGIKWLTDEVIGCEFDYTDSDVQPYTGSYYFAIGGIVLDTNKKFLVGPTYTLDLYVEGIKFDSIPVVTVADKPTNVPFGPYDDPVRDLAPVIICDFCQ